MLKPMEVVMIQNAVQGGATIGAIARQLGIDRKTVRAALRRKVRFGRSDWGADGHVTNGA
jgi:transposase